ncbi:glycosyltransferase family 4 protein [Nakamurella sp. GG22]
MTQASKIDKEQHHASQERLEDMKESALIISAAPPVPVDNGKRMVMNGLLTYFVDRLGADNVHYAMLGRPGDERPVFPGIAHRLDPPSTLGQLGALGARLALNRSYTAQEAMLGSAALRDQIHALISWLKPTVEVYDTLRLGQHAPVRSGASRRILYLDDLFSLRYEKMLKFAKENPVTIDPLGEFASNVPSALRALVRFPRVYKPVLRMERRRIQRREIQMVQDFDTSLLVNRNEVEILRERADSSSVRLIHALLPPISAPTRRPVTPPEFLFLGRLNIPHNDDGICGFLREGMPGLIERLPDVMVRLIGKGASAELQRLVAQYPDNVRLEGFVEDLEPLFARASASLAPLRFGTGIKIKTLDSLARGLPVLATGGGADGIPLGSNGADGCVVEDDFRRWPRLLAEMAGRHRNTQLSRAALAFFERTYSPNVVMDQYDDIFALGDRSRARTTERAFAQSAARHPTLL